jgi:GT2 family glycosyltransferase
MNITFCIPSKDNLRYLKSSIKSIQENSTYDNKIIVWVDSSNDGTLEWLAENKIDHIINHKDKPQGIAAGYNRCIEAAETDVVCMFHADMFMGRGFDTNTLKHLKPSVVVSATRIEPPLHPHGLEKIVKNFGMYPEDFVEEAFDSFIEECRAIHKDVTTKGVFAPWLCYKSDILAIGLHDEEFHSYHEDSDIFNRMLLSGMSCVQSRDAFVYHLTCRGGQFQDGIDKVSSDEAFHKMKNKAAKYYLRKWGSWVRNDEHQHPIITPKYDIGFWIENCNEAALELLEPWCSTLYTDCAWASYVEKEQPNTQYDLSKRIVSSIDKPTNDIVVYFDAKKLTQQSYQIIQQLSQIIKESGEVGTFELDIFQIQINALTEYQNNLVVCNTSSSSQVIKNQIH